MRRIRSFLSSRVIIILFSLLVSVTIASFADEGIDLFKRIEGISGVTYTPGVFVIGGNAGNVTFINQVQEETVGSSGVYLDTTTNTLSGVFFLDTVGWANLGLPGYPVSMIPPGGDTQNVITPWAIIGNAWTDNAGWISLDAMNDSYSGVFFIPYSNSFTGYAWSDNLGYIDFGQTFSNTILAKVKVVGTIAGVKSFDNSFYNIGSTFNSVTFNSFINEIKKNIAILTRSVPTENINTSNIYNPATLKLVNPNLAYFKLDATNSGKYIVTGTGMSNILSYHDIRTLVIDGGNLYINGDITEEPLVNKPRAIIVLKDRNGNGGDVYVHGSVKKIYSTIIAEGTLYSGFPTSGQGILPITSFLYNDTKEKTTNLPANQLYINGSLMSRNTIGGSTETVTAKNGTCPYTETNCNRDTSVKYDLNYFRAFNKESSRRAYIDNSLDDYSLVVGFDSRILTDPPPGISQ